jgi:uracil-DNA glycosylase
MRQLEAFLAKEVADGQTIYPPFEQTFSALCHTRFEDVKVVIMGQDPYHGAGQAHGLSFSVAPGVPIPPSLQNIYKELATDVGFSRPAHGSLVGWARQGVLLLNATLSVREGQPRSHYGQGGEVFTDRIVQLLAERARPLVFILWGKSAYEKWQHAASGSIESPHLVLSSPHPSPLSAYTGFFGCQHFSKTNIFLKEAGIEPIDWNL